MMGYRIFLAGASGAIGRRLTPLLRSAGHYVCGSTRSEANVNTLRSLGADPIVVDVFDASALSRVVASARPDVVIHQLTDLPKDLNPREMGAAIVRTARIRSEGTRNLVRAAIAGGARRMVAQSIAWAYAPGLQPHAETDALDAGADGESGINLQGVIALEDLILKSPPLEGVVLRYGQLYGPGTASDRPSNSAPVHVDAAAYAVLLAIDRGDSGIYNIAQSNKYASTEKARVQLGWTPDFRLPA
ncbi:Nucleoside-diphosphate-sugar epimerase [Bradyrhizobium shewense]|uniref:Nucleoside-diphosphate-sugar epimerase n=1 Tax=Bradyrhizobium shewense TaxID=1761772 RepID=A0A1C3US69_9BRAD|nr:Nucleoside-diphosphate-sugar epimerase [Bradyrhizobium shewense]